MLRPISGDGIRISPTWRVVVPLIGTLSPYFLGDGHYFSFEKAALTTSWINP